MLTPPTKRSVEEAPVSEPKDQIPFSCYSYTEFLTPSLHEAAANQGGTELLYYRELQMLSGYVTQCTLLTAGTKCGSSTALVPVRNALIMTSLPCFPSFTTARVSQEFEYPEQENE